jgi:hypothetical protein
VTTSRSALCILLLGVLLTLVACTTPKGGKPDVAVPTYGQLAKRYNANLEGLERLWGRVVVEMWWTDDEGDSHYQQGDGVLLLMLPDRIALSISKGKVLFWIGCDAERYWMLDLRDKHDRKAYFGQHNLLGTGPSSPELPIPIHPQQLRLLLGLAQLDPIPAGSPQPQVKAKAGAWAIELPQENYHISIDPTTALPTSITLLDRDGEPAVQAVLTEVVTLELALAPRRTWPRIRKRIDLRLPDGSARLRLHLTTGPGLTDARGPHQKTKSKAFTSAFDFELLARTFRAQPTDLDDRSPSDE